MKIYNKQYLSCSYKLLLRFVLLCVLCSSTALAQYSSYRVELIVLRHVDAVSSHQPVAILKDFSTAIDLLPRSTEPTIAADQILPEPPPADRPAVLTDAATDPAELLDETPPPLAVIVPEPGEVMAEAWRRLRLSAAFRPELYLSWQQGFTEPFPLIRIHDDQVLIEREPVTSAIYGTPDDFPPVIPTSDPTPTPGDANASAVAETEAALGAAPNVAGVEAEADMEELPTPELSLFYRIDGTASLRLSRFLHLELDVELREPLGTVAPGQSPPAAADDEGNRLPPPAFIVHTIHQQRQVKLQEMAYFDGPVIGILALVTRVESEPPQTADGGSEVPSP